MSNITHREKFNRLDVHIWKRTKVDSQGRATLPQKLRRKLGLNENSMILWISANQIKKNIFIIEVGIKNED
jgi:bifunctional DNA-binding transcriptional regulator/antitoxin component of YhaV-PrlF toxin-antitoxin module